MVSVLQLGNKNTQHCLLQITLDYDTFLDEKDLIRLRTGNHNVLLQHKSVK